MIRSIYLFKSNEQWYQTISHLTFTLCQNTQNKRHSKALHAFYTGEHIPFFFLIKHKTFSIFIYIKYVNIHPATQGHKTHLPLIPSMK